MRLRLHLAAFTLALVSAVGVAALCGDEPDSPPPSSAVTPQATRTSAVPTPEPTIGGARKITWDEAVDLFMSCQVTSAMQAHSLQIWLELRDGSSVTTVEPAIDQVFDVVRDATVAGCDQIQLATE